MQRVLVMVLLEQLYKVVRHLLVLEAQLSVAVVMEAEITFLILLVVGAQDIMEEVLLVTQVMELLEVLVAL